MLPSANASPLPAPGYTLKSVADLQGPPADFPELYKTSELAARNRTDAQAEAEHKGAELKVSTRYAQPWRRQLAVLSGKFRKIYWRKPDYNLVRCVTFLLQRSTAYLQVLHVPSELASVAFWHLLHHSLCVCADGNVALQNLASNRAISEIVCAH